MRALITGATGLIGGRLAERLLGDGAEVVVVGRDVARLRERFPGERVSAVAWDGATLPASALEGVDAIFHLAGEPVAAGRWTDARKARIRESRVDSTRSIVEAMRRAPRGAGAEGGARVLVCASAIGIYGARGDEKLSETSACAPAGEDFLADVCVAWEAEARAAEALGARVASVRIGIVVARHGGALATMLPLFRAGLGGRLGNGKQWMSWIHVDDVVGVLLHAAREPAVRGPMNAVAPTPVTNAEFTRALGKALHRPALLPAPTFALRAALGEMADVVLASQRVLPEVALRTGYAFRHTTLEGALARELDKGAASAQVHA
jgi:hypothetical protein